MQQTDDSDRRGEPERVNPSLRCILVWLLHSCLLLATQQVLLNLNVCSVSFIRLHKPNFKKMQGQSPI